MTATTSELEDLRLEARVARPCDLVLKGGLASGLVYPRAVCRVAQKFHLVGIGGTSAGALVASIAAAAEYQRREERSDAGFVHLQRATAELMGEGRMLDLFRPDRGTRAPYWMFQRLVFESQARGGFLKVLLAWAAPLVTLVVVAAIGVGVLRDSIWAGLFSVVLIGFVVAALLAANGVWVGRKWLRSWRENGYGMASGMGQGNAAGDGELPPLSEWLHEQIQAAAGRSVDDAPLTFGDLHGAQLPECLEDLVGAGGGRSIDYRAITTCLGLARPYELPLATKEFGYRSEELRKLLPARVVDFLDAKSDEYQEHRGGGSTRACAKTGVRPLPGGVDMPIVMAARMSLSFPGLLAMVPLWARDLEAGKFSSIEEAPMRRLWFSDGGITSNFPAHRFDSVLPRWPTLAINLQYDGARKEPARRGARDPEAERVYLAESRSERPHALHPTRVEGADGEFAAIKGFLGSIFTSAQTWNDNGFLRLPSFHDRVAEVWLSKEEGGLNLKMDPAVMRGLVLRGDLAARRLAERFADVADEGTADKITPMTWHDHRWARYRASMAAIARLLETYDRGFNRPQGLDRPWRKHFDGESLSQAGFSYFAPRSERQQAAMLEDTEGLLRLADAWDAVEAEGRRSRFREGPQPDAGLAAQAPLDR